jgi:UDP-N-acetylglucosamine 1-carboxyvinyltransferase
MMAAVLAEGTTVIDGAAEEPEVEDLANFLIAMGAKLRAPAHDASSSRSKGTPWSRARGHSGSHRGGNFPTAAAIVGNEVTITRAQPSHLKAVLGPLAQAGFSISTGKDSVTLRSNGSGHPLKLETSPYPGFPTDMQAQMCALLSTIDGISVVTENVFPQRFMHVAELKRMGANIELQGPTAVING